MKAEQPLRWPASVPRTPAHKRLPSQFGTKSGKLIPLSIDEATARLEKQAKFFGASGVVLTHSGVESPDTGAAVYFKLKGKPYCLPCDRWNRLPDNIAAVAAHIKATREIERFGVGTLEGQLRGFTALPPAERRTGPLTGCWRILGLRKGSTKAEIEAAYRARAKEVHPDCGGNSAAMRDLILAREEALRALELAEAVRASEDREHNTPFTRRP